MLGPINSSRVWLEREISAFAQSVPNGSLVLDAGSGSQPYRHLFSSHNYESADFELMANEYGDTDYVCDLGAIPVEDCRYDAVLFSQVMEHLPRPAEALNELFRVLKPGGRLLFSAPLYYEEHGQPYDFYRYTQFGIRSLFSDAGFALTDLRWLEGYLGTLAYQLGLMTRALPTHPRDLGGGKLGITLSVFFVGFKPVARWLAARLHEADTRHRHTMSGHPKNYVAVAERPR
jgi:SAM-dependent methyltransferase